MSGYTPEQLREWADDWEKDAAGDTENWRRTVYLSHAAQLRAHATTLEQLPAAQAEIKRLRDVISGGHCIRGEDGKSPCERLREDAERYRYLRSRNKEEVFDNEGEKAGVWIDCTNEEGDLQLLTFEDADAAIDKARRA